MLILLVALCVRLLPVLCHGAHPVLFMDPDSWEYHRLASNLVAGNGYSWETQAPYAPNLYRTPGLPMLLAGVYAVTGASIPAAIVLQAVMSTVNVLLTFFLASALTRRPGIALTAAAVLALDPVAIQYSNLLLTETFTSALILCAVGCLWQYQRTAATIWLLATGAVLAVGILMHPVLLYLPLLLPLVPFLRRSTRTGRQVAIALAATLLALAPASAWIVRNARVGDLPGISSVTAVNMLKYKAAGVEAELRGTSREVERDRLTDECEAELPADATPGDRFRLWQRRATAILLAHPLTYCKVHAKGMLIEMFGVERDHTTRLLYGDAVLNQKGEYTDASIKEARARGPVLALEAARYGILGWQAVLMLGLAIGIWSTARTRPGFFAILLIVPIYVLILSGGPEACPRFRVLYLPIFSLLTAFGAERILKRREKASPATALSIPGDMESISSGWPCSNLGMEIQVLGCHGLYSTRVERVKRTG
jgi:4-amino-4-deoxy-L-arabinose transferase-like glycosyltransferase